MSITPSPRHKIGLSLAALGLQFMFAAPGQAGDCWLDIYDRTNYDGNHVRLEGPADFPSLSKLNGQDWGSRIDSLVVGPAAEVQAFRQESFKDDSSGLPYHGDAIKAWGEDPKAYSDKEITFGPGRKEHHLGELNFHENINSLKIRCRP
jgi:hypothetical protein